MFPNDFCSPFCFFMFFVYLSLLLFTYHYCLPIIFVYLSFLFTYHYCLPLIIVYLSLLVTSDYCLPIIFVPLSFSFHYHFCSIMIFVHLSFSFPIHVQSPVIFVPVLFTKSYQSHIIFCLSVIYFLSVCHIFLTERRPSGHFSTQTVELFCSWYQRFLQA